MNIAGNLYMCGFFLGLIGLAISEAALVFTEHWFCAGALVIVVVPYVVFGLDYGVEHDFRSKR